MVVARKGLPRVSWRTRGERLLHGCDTEDQRRAVEDKERERWVGMLIQLLEVTGLIDGEKRGPQGLKYFVNRFAMGRRGSTIRQHVLHGKRLHEYMKSIYREQKITSAASLQHFLLELERGDHWLPKPTIKAARLPVEVVRALEMAVMDNDLHPYKRTFAWYKLLKLWGARRCHDAEGIPPASISYDPTTGFEADITRSKTTGAGRRVEVVQIFVSSSACLVCRDWLRVGLEIFVGMGKEAGTGMRDYLMARPNHQLDGFRKSMMKYADAMAYSRALLAELPSRLVDGEGRKVPLLLPESTAYFSEHSERITMMSWAAVCGVEKEDRRRWGRWRPSVDEGYVTTTRRLTFEAQKTVAKRIWGTYGVHDLVDDDMATVKHFTLWLQDVHKKVPSQANREAQPIAPPQWGMVHGKVQQPVEPEMVEDGGGSASAEGQEGPVQVDSPSVRSWSPTEIFSEEEDQNVDAADKGDEFPMGTFVLSVVGRSKARTLHVIGGCYRIPGVHYREYVVVGSERPDIDPKQGEKLCSTCFGA
ncbi:DnaJ-like subfamily C member 17 [Durusdinium trenchii]|uniref:DnaJ-like subfamily C member 17 n=1 Tax=Durusdinium trenchii TaxID=1381693 RepID=A0ABP0LF89_9DINO